MQLVIGRILRAHGVRGEVVVEITTDEPAARFVAGSVLVTDPAAAGPLSIEGLRPHQGRLIVAFDGVLDRDGADALRDVKLLVDSAEVTDPDDPDEFNDFQLVGLIVVDVAGEKLGEVLRVEHGPAAELLVVRLTDGRTGLVPFVKAIVASVDLDSRQVVLTPPEGLFDV